MHVARVDGDKGRVDVTPGRFLLPGDLAGSPVLTFAPLPKPALTPRACLWREMERRYDAYKSKVVRPFFQDHFARLDRQVVLMDVLGIGVFITGDSGAGKSELALELISRGHGLVADDIVEFSRIAPNVLEGRCPELLQDVIEVRGLGILNIRTIFGETACRRKMKLKLVVHLQRRQPGQEDPLRLSHDAEEQLILGIPVRRVVLPVAAGRNLAVLVECAVRDHILRLGGYNAERDLMERLQEEMTGGAT